MKAKPTTKPGTALLEVTTEGEPFLESARPKTPFRISNILVPIDFSDCSRKALRYALALAEGHEASITLLYVMYTPIAHLLDGGVGAEAEEVVILPAGETDSAGIGGEHDSRLERLQLKSTL